eukprot:gene8499-9408_t
MAMSNRTGYGPRTRLIFDGDEKKYELWETKFLGYLHTLKLKAELDKNQPDAEKNTDIYAELIQLLDDRSLALVMRDAKDNGKKALTILREHYLSQGKPKVIALYTELTTLSKGEEETITDYIIRAEAAAASLKSSGEVIGDSLLIAMVLKGLPASFNSFKTVITQREKQQTFQEFKVSLRSFEESEHVQSKSDSVMKLNFRQPSQISCYVCKKRGHKAADCKQKRWCDNCKSKTHDTRFCRKKSEKSSVSKVDLVEKGESKCTEEKVDFFFKIGVDPNMELELGDVNLLVDCGATTHIINDESKFVSFDQAFNPQKHYIELADGSRSNNVALKRGTAKLFLQDTKGNMHGIFLQNALYAPSYKQNIFSVQAATEKGATVDFSSEGASLTTKNGTSFDVKKNERLYFLNKCKAGFVKQATRDIKTWHKIFGHCNLHDIRKLPDVVSGMNITKKTSDPLCEACTLGKMCEFRSRIPDEKAKTPLELVHCDLSGPIDPVSIDGFKYAISFTDDYSGLMMTYFLKQKSDTVEATRKFLADISPIGKVKCIRSDNGSEFISKEFQACLTSQGICHEKSAPYSPHQNGTAERGWRSLFEMARCLLIDAKLPKFLWTYAVLASCYIRNRCFNSRLMKTAYEAFTGKKPNVQNMNIFGTVCYAYIQERKKLDPRSEKGLFIGYDKYSPAYYVYFEDRRIIKKVRCVAFTNEFPSVSKDIEQDDEFNDQDHRVILPSDETKNTIANESTPESTRRYPLRQRRQPEYLNDHVTGDEHSDEDNVNCNIDYCYSVRDVPQTYAEAVNCSDSNGWESAMNEEMSSLRENNTFTLTPLTKGKQTVGGRWVYAIKENADGTSHYKARYVAKGYSQTRDVDYYETFTPTTQMTSVRVLMQLAAQHNLIIHQMDVKTAYLNAPIDCEIYLEQAKGYEIPGKDGAKLVYKLNKSLYGLKQSGRNWNNLLNDHLIDQGFKQSLADPCMYVKHDGKDVAILLVWVDDIIIASDTIPMLEEVKTMLSERFKMKDMGVISRFLGIDFKVEDEKITMDQEEYRKAIGSLIYAMTCTRPDLSWTVTKLAQYSHNPTVEHWTTVKHSRKQPTVALSTCEAEYIATTVAAQEGKFLKQLLNDIEIDIVDRPIMLFTDNQSAIAVAKDPIKSQRNKHIDIKYHFIRSEIKTGNIILQYVPSEENFADVFTKSMTK